MIKELNQVPEFKCRASKGEVTVVNGKRKDGVGQTFVTYLQEWLVYQLTGSLKEIDSKYLLHGIATEPQALERAGKYYGCKFEKNTTQLENEHFTGEFDSKSDSIVIDTKSSFTAQTFPYFMTKPPKGYHAQLQIYMDLTGLKKASLIYCLENGTIDEINALAWKYAKREAVENGLIDCEMEVHHYEQAEKQLNYDHLPDWMRIKVFEFDRDDKLIDTMKSRVEIGRSIIKNELFPEIEKMRLK